MKPHPLVRALLAAAANAAFGALPDALGVLAPRPPDDWSGALKHRGQASINYAARVARSHAGKPAGYVKGY